MPIEEQLGKGGFSFPVSDYVADLLPLSIGLRSNNLSLRAMADYQLGNWSATASGTYVVRINIKIDRNAYYTTEMHYTNEVEMPDVAQLYFRTGYRSERMIAEAMVWNIFPLIFPGAPPLAVLLQLYLVS